MQIKTSKYALKTSKYALKNYDMCKNKSKTKTSKNFEYGQSKKFLIIFFGKTSI
jgi:hypothetical protein